MVEHKCSDWRRSGSDSGCKPGSFVLAVRLLPRIAACPSFSLSGRIISIASSTKLVCEAGCSTLDMRISQDNLMTGCSSEMSLVSEAVSLGSFVRSMSLLNEQRPGIWVHQHGLGNLSTISCVCIEGLRLLSGRDLVDSIAYRLGLIGAPVRNHKQFEIGLFSDLRNLRTGIDCQIEPAKVRTKPPTNHPSGLTGLTCLVNLAVWSTLYST